ncbi:hypothetical protein [Sphingomonas abietis]|uniref:Uncharacterized protein n=1 Tax=Sphingomonas abietis TaxID=3012344 RepID=A0ABY7NQW5_9SPHN|nr:hypothetical protein [Sphingomonas abietis]WBO23937.1 hypothetical protein PBT88_07460 [Sphingomonas abietis]
MATNPDAAVKSAAKKVRVLVAHEEHRPHHVLTLPTKEADAAVKDGWACDDPEGIAYSEKNEAQPAAEKA